MQALNIYFLTRIDDPACFSEYESALAGIRSVRAPRPHEQGSLHALVGELEGRNLPLSAFDGFFLSFVISHISKEFDLLKIAADHSMVLNIELKSQEVDTSRILRQLKQNRYYLRHLSGTVFSYTYVTGAGKLYTLSEDETLITCSFDSLVEDMLRFGDCVNSDIESLFRAEDFLISPSSTPDKFLKRSYFLTTQQNDFKAQIMEQIDHMQDGGILCLTGSPGTGKTLLLYDLAMELASSSEVCILHCGLIQEVHRYLDQKMEHVRIFSISDIKSPADLSAFSLILVDEAHSITAKQFELIRRSVKRCEQVCVFSFDSRQILYASEESRETVLLIQSLSAGIYKLSDKIRAGKELSSFIISLFQPHKRINIYDYRNVQILYAKNREEAGLILTYLMEKNYTFLDYDQSWEELSSSHQNRRDSMLIVGQEYDAVVTVMDDRFFYDPEGKLSTGQAEDAQSPLRELLFQAVSQARIQLALVIIGNPDLFTKVNGLKLIK